MPFLRSQHLQWFTLFPEDQAQHRTRTLTQRAYEIFPQSNTPYTVLYTAINYGTLISTPTLDFALLGVTLENTWDHEDPESGVLLNARQMHASNLKSVSTPMNLPKNRECITQTKLMIVYREDTNDHIQWATLETQDRLSLCCRSFSWCKSSAACIANATVFACLISFLVVFPWAVQQLAYNVSISLENHSARNAIIIPKSTNGKSFIG